MMRRSPGVFALTLLTIGLPSPARPDDETAFRKLADIDRRYARGDHPEAIGMLGLWTDMDLQVQAAEVEVLFKAKERCPKCPSALDGLPLRAAAMLHADRDRVLRFRDAGEEQPRPCPGALALIAGRYAALLARDPSTRDFARRFLLAMAMRSQWDACFAEGVAWSDAGRAQFPDDPEILVTAGSILEEWAFVASLMRGTDWGRGDKPKDLLKEADRLLARAIAGDPDLALARLRRGRVLWRLGQMEPAREALEAAVARIRDPRHAYLAHLFLGRVHEDEHQFDEAVAEYKAAVDLDPKAQSGAVALSAGLQQSGDREGARRALAAGLEEAGRRTTADPYGTYFVTNASGLESRFQELRRETAEP